MSKKETMLEEAKRKNKGYEFVDDGKGVVLSPKLKKYLVEKRLKEEWKNKEKKGK